MILLPMALIIGVAHPLLVSGAGAAGINPALTDAVTQCIAALQSAAPAFR